LNIIRRRLDILYRRRYDLQINQKNGYFDVSLTIKLT
jgi:two-component system LytT family sensor kinase